MRRKITVLSLLLAGVAIILFAVAPLALAVDAPDHVIKLMYFHRRFRCPSCEVIETGIGDVLKTHYAEHLKNGAIRWQVINLDEEGNGHYPDTYDFFYNTLIIAEERNGKDVRYKNLQKIYEFDRNIPGLKEYVRKEVEEYLR